MKKEHIYKTAGFLIILGLILKAASFLSVRMDRKLTPVFIHSSTCLFNEPDNSIDVLAIGDSNTYSGIAPLLWWENYGISGYAWGEPSQRIAETHAYLKRIYKHQKPSVVFLEADNIFRDQSAAENLNSIVKAGIAKAFPVVTYHKSLDPHKLPNVFSNPRSLTKGYYIRRSIKKVHNYKPKLDKVRESKPIHPISSRELGRCIKLCQDHGSEVILLSVPSCKGWDYKKHNAIAREAGKHHLTYLDLNLLLQEQMNWDQDSADGREHLNIYGAKKVTDFLGQYLHENYSMKDHRSEESYSIWNQDLEEYKAALSNPKKYDDEEEN